MSGWTYDVGDVLVKTRNENAGILNNTGKGWRIIFGSRQLSSNLTRIDMTGQSHGGEDQEGPTISCFIAAADLIHYELGAHSTVVIHCVNGNSRTGHALITYLIRHGGMEVDDAEKLVTAAQHERGMRQFDVHQKKSLHNYFDWINANIDTIKNKGNEGSNRSSYVTSNPAKNGNKILHAVQENKSSSSSGAVGHSGGIGEFEMYWLKKNAEVYMGYPTHF